MKVLALVLSILALGVAFAFGGTLALIGMAIGLGGTAFNIAALYGAISLATSNQERGGTTRAGSILLILGLFVKLPVLILLGLYAQSLGTESGAAFLGGLFVVYGWLVIYTVVDARRKIREEDARSKQEPGLRNGV